MKLTLKAEILPAPEAYFTPILNYFYRDPRFQVEEGDGGTYAFMVEDYSHIWLDYQEPCEDYGEAGEEILYIEIFGGAVPKGFLFDQLYRNCRDLGKRVVEEPGFLPELADNFLGLVDLAINEGVKRDKQKRNRT